jgi:RNA polymerase sigma-70 factor (ECF subfamily)
MLSLVSALVVIDDFSAPQTSTPGRELDPSRLGDHLDRLYRAAVGLCGSHADAEDLVQETFVAVLRRPRLLRSDDDIGYLLRVLRNTFYSRYRAESRRPRAADLAEHEELPEPRTGLAPDAMVASREVLAAVAALPEPYREAVAAVDLAGLSYREAAAALNTREGTIMSRLHRGRAQVAESLGYTS